MYVFVCFLSSTADSKIIGTCPTVFNDFLVVNWYKNPLKTVGPVPIILQSPVYACTCLSVCDVQLVSVCLLFSYMHVYLHACTHACDILNYYVSLYMSMCVYTTLLFVCKHVHTCMHMYTEKLQRIVTCYFLRIARCALRTYIHIHVYVGMHACIPRDDCVCILQAYTRTYAHTRMCTYMYACMYVYECARTYTHAFIYI